MVVRTSKPHVIYTFGEFAVDKSARTLTSHGEDIHLPAKEFDILLYLVENEGRILSKDELMAAIWQETFVEESNLAQYISRLRKILDTNGHKYIRTLPKRGYCFEADVRTFRGAETDRRRILSWTLGAAVVVTVILLGVGSRYLRSGAQDGSKAVARPTPVAITDGKQDDGVIAWTRDNRLRFLRDSATRRYESWVMNIDGTDAHRESVKIDGFLNGIWSPDGKKVHFMKEGDDKTTYLANSDGSDEIVLPLLVGSSDWSPDGSRFVYESTVGEGNTDIFLYTVATHQNVNLTRSENFDADPAFTPDGQHVVYVSGRDGNADIYMMDLDGHDTRRMTDHPAFDNHPSISPDGTQLLFLSNRDGRDAQLYIKDIDDDSPPVRLTDMPGIEGNNAKCWSPDGTQIVFTAEADGKDRVFVLDVSSFPAVPAIADRDVDLGSPKVSPDGLRILFEARMPDRSIELRIKDLNAAAWITVYRTEPGLSAALSLSPDWSSDGQKVVFDNDVNGNTDIYTINADGSGLVRLTDDPLPDLTPKFSADGSRIYFARDFYGKPRTFEMNADGSDARQFSEQPGYEMSATVSPDGKSLIVSADRLDGRKMGLDLYTIPLDGREGEHLLVSRPEHEVGAAFSPDGRRIAFVANSDGNSEIYIANSDGSGQTRVTRSKASDLAPSFSADGNTLFFSSNRDGRYAIYRVELPRPSSAQ